MCVLYGFVYVCSHVYARTHVPGPGVWCVVYVYGFVYVYSHVYVCTHVHGPGVWCVYKGLYTCTHMCMHTHMYVDLEAGSDI